jgi:hypothetical protein
MLQRFIRFRSPVCKSTTSVPCIEAPQKTCNIAETRFSFCRATPYYQFVSPNVTSPDGRLNGQGAIIPHATNIGVPPTGFTPSSSNGYTDPRTLPADTVTYPEGFQSQLANAVSNPFVDGRF